ncbi:MAG: OadG family protein [Clostridia bacterium]|nr:OadG family protein [Clostridia bacterium]MDD4798683.1 OadG family protein [Clostridia bacterium]
MGVKEALLLSGQTTLIGLTVVFLALVGLMFVIIILNKTLGGQRKPKQEAQPVTEKAATKQLSVAAPVDLVSPIDIDAKTVAVIMAAVEAASGREISTLRFTAIRRTRQTAKNPWAYAGAEGIINSRQTFN